MGGRSARRIGGVIVAAGMTAAACGGAAPPESDVPVTTPTTTVPDAPIADGVLHIGVFLPGTGPGARIGQPMIDAVEAAVDAIDAAGGVLGRPVTTTYLDEETAVGFGPLLQAGVDAIIGPASSRVALASLTEAVNAGVLVCTPSATALGLDDFPDQGLLFRTVGSDTLQMAALARTAARTGSGSVAVVYLDDPYGRGLLDAFRGAVGNRSTISISEEIPFAADDPDLLDEATATVAAGSGIIALLGDADDGGRMLTALDRAILGAADEVDSPFIVMNDSLRDAADVIADLDDTTRSSIIGVAPRSVVPSVDEPAGFFATNAHDCATLIALAAVQAGSDRPTAIADQMASVSSGGRLCSGFAECVTLMSEGLQIDYSGLSGGVDLTSTGDLSRAWFREFRFDAQGREYILNPSGVEAP
jgi:branched-chain amino acid transport system substrate-binding protein